MRYTNPIRSFKVEFINNGILEMVGEYKFHKKYAKRVPISLISAKKFLLKLLREKKIVSDYDLKTNKWFLVKYGARGMLLNVQDFK